MRTSLSWTSPSFLLAGALAASLAASACSGGGGGSGGTGGTSTTGTGGSTGSGGPVAGDADKHCGSTVAKVDPLSCLGMGGAGGGMMTGGAAGSTGSGTMPASEYGETLYNAEGDDDDCKYHVKFSSTDVGQGKDVTFTVTVTSKTDDKPVTGAAPDIEAFLNDTHPAPNSNQKPTEKGNGVYDVGPMKFDASGKWTVRFHFFEECSDSETSPHSHVAFYLNVP